MSQKGRTTLFLASLIFDSGFPSLTLVEPGMMLWYEIVRPEQQATTAKPKSEPNRRSSRYIIYFRSRRRRGNNSGGLVLCIFAAKAHAQFQKCSSIFFTSASVLRNALCVIWCFRMRWLVIWVLSVIWISGCLRMTLTSGLGWLVHCFGYYVFLSLTRCCQPVHWCSCEICKTIKVEIFSDAPNMDLSYWSYK